MNASPVNLALPTSALIGMVHVPALPGTPRGRQSVEQIAERAAAEAAQLEQAGCDAVIIENMHDRPYLLRQVGPEIVSAMTAAGLAVRSRTACPLGIQVLAGANCAALAVACACGASFIRVEGFVFGHVADEGLFADADAGPLLRYRRQIQGDSIAVIADIKKKHSAHALTADVNIAATAHAAEFCGADGIVITGSSTGQPTSVEDLRQAKSAVGLPVFVGSGVTPDNLAGLWGLADAFIVGSYFKVDGKWHNAIDPDRLKRMVAAVRAQREAQ